VLKTLNNNFFWVPALTIALLFNLWALICNVGDWVNWTAVFICTLALLTRLILKIFPAADSD
jgi:hypothetical protein